MAEESKIMKDEKNLFCHRSDLNNESSVESFFVLRLLKHLHYKDSDIKPKNSLKEIVIGRGSKKENYKPDYVCFCDKKPKIVIDAKPTNEDIDDWVYQVSGYALDLNRKFKGENPVRYTILTNGINFKLYNWDEEEPILSMIFKDFNLESPKFKKLVELIDFDNIAKQTGIDEIFIEDFIKKASVDDIKYSFKKCHNLIWKKEKISPTDAFYEFSKIIFVKLNEDKRLRKIIESGEKLKRSDFKFSVNWLKEREDETENPLSSILFAELIKNLNEEVEKNKKKPIFLDDFIELKTDTIQEVVKILQNFDLYTIDEDLNGRMFEEFLNATIRGKELGQYFTPRKMVKFMTKLANLKIIYDEDNEEYFSQTVLDACCGSGGFLIDAMADLIAKLKARKDLEPYRKDITNKIQKRSIFGIEANPKVSRIARMNMHVHGDGGSRIYCADSLDKKVQIKKGVRKEVKKDMEELKKILIEEKKKFDVVLTNPPFSMSYKKKEEDEKEILEQYASDKEDENLSYETGTTNLKASVKSNVLFVARYFELLEPNGKLFIVLDNSVLNSYSHKEYRDFIRKNFVIKAVFSLPTHTFVNQEAGGITSILFLQKKAEPTQKQGMIFARVIENIGHNESGKELNFDDFDDVLKEYTKYEKDGKLLLKGEIEIKNYENDILFLISPEKITDRFDVFFHQPSYHKLLENIRKRAKEGKCELQKLDDFEIIKSIDEEIRDKRIDAEEDKEKIYKYIEISAIDKERGFIINGEWEEAKREELPSRAKLLIKQNDLLFSMPFRSLKKVAIVPDELNGHLASNGFYGIRPKDYKESCLLWAIFRSNLIQKQLNHLSSGYTQRGLSDEHLKEYLLIPIPKNKEEISKIVSENIKKAIKSRKLEIQSLNKIVEAPEKAIFE